MSDLDHVSINVTDYARSKRFYEQALAPLGMKLFMEGESGAGFGRRYPHFWIRAGIGTFQSAEQVRVITPAHVCFTAADHAEVQAFYTAALAGGGRDFGAPGLRPKYHSRYFGAFVLDPDGHNIEAVVHAPPRQPIILRPGEGRDYPMGRIRALFKADRAETGRAYSISEWWLDANTKGPGAHSHREDDVFYVIEGTMSVLVGAAWFDAPAGSFVLVPGGVTHDFENRSDARAGVLNFYAGVFEPEMKAIAAWYAEHPPGDAR